MSKEHWNAIEQREAAVDQWNKQVEQVIEAEGTFTAERDLGWPMTISEGCNKRISRKYHIELDRDPGRGQLDAERGHDEDRRHKHQAHRSPCHIERSFQRECGDVVMHRSK